MNIFEQLLEGIFLQKNLKDKNAQIKFLRGLQGTGTQLWKSYRNDAISMDYADEKIQHAYLLRYFPFYVKLLPQVLRDLEEHGVRLPDVPMLCPMFFGCGPCPEIVGLLDFLNENNFPNCKTIAPQFIDQKASEWDPSLRLATNYVADPRLKLHDRKWKKGTLITADIANADLLNKIDSTNCHLAVFQNCFNELPDRDHVVKNIIKIAESMPIGSLIVIIDRSGYNITQDRLEKLKSEAVQSKKVSVVGNSSMESQTCDKCRQLLNEVKETIIHGNLYYAYGNNYDWWYDRELNYARNIPFVSLAIRRQTSTKNGADDASVDMPV